ncbi:MAG: hypothetical protein KF733_03290 [Fimbriimonadaceae bacterium]|nr:MAG: hypothetical protein KF733_03290 [Fimbriimonadaceae bacterium]
MNLTEYAAERKRAAYERLRAGLEPEEGLYDQALLQEARTHGEPRVGSTTYTPDSIRMEFIYSGAGQTLVFSVTLPAPERIVFLPVPKWVVETIWQGDVDGSYHFESRARELLEEFRAETEPGSNDKWFGAQRAKRRE